MDAFLYVNKQINIPYLLKIGNGKIGKIGKYLADKNFNNIAIFLSEGIDEVVGKIFYDGLQIHKISIIHKQFVTNINIEDINKTAFSLDPTIHAIVGIGGGKALDYAKYAADLLKLPFISVPTSASNDGFCSPNASLFVDGNRKSVKSMIPFGVVVDLDILLKSPLIFFYSGLGDMASKITALRDWKDATERGLAKYSDFAAMLSYNSLDLLFIKHSFDVTSQEFQRSLVSSLLTSGIAMEISGSSRPASGSEHLISHALDKISIKPQMHGIQVGVATYLCALLQDNQDLFHLQKIFSATGFFDFVKKNPFSKAEFIEALKLAPSIKNNYFTVLSEGKSFARALSFIEKDEFLRSIII